VGTFLHATRIPLAGLVMASAAVILLVASRMLIRRPGFALRAALVCAALRALSPEGLMPGPMVAIVLQGALVEGAFLLLRAPLAAGLAAGGLAALATQLQALLVKLVAYGAELWEILEQLVARAEGLLGMEGGEGWALVAAYLAIVLALGLAAGLVGWRLGRTALEIERGQTRHEE
jgi:hypothetical protein